MLPSVSDWLAASWADYGRRWPALMAVLTAGFLATLAAVLVPLLPAALLAYSGAGSPWLIFGAGWTVALLGAMWISTWAQAAAIRSAAADEAAEVSLREGWRRTPAFALVLSLALLAAGGGFVLLIVPGLILGVLVFFAPFYQLSGEETGLAAVELSYARVRPVFGAAAGRLLLLFAVAWLPGWIPWIGWLLGLVLTPFALVACARLADDLKALSPAPERPRLGAPVAALGAVLLLATVAASWGASRAVFALADAYASGAVALPDEETARSMLAILQGAGGEEDRRRSMTYVLALSSAPAPAAP